MTLHDLQARSSPSLEFYDAASQLQRHIYRRYEEALAAGDAAREAIRTPEALAARQRWVRETFLSGIGGLPQSDTPLEPRVMGTIEAEGYRIEKIILTARPGVFVTTNLYLPEGITAPRGAVLFVCGHHAQAKHAEEYQVVCQHLVQAGLVVLAQDPVGQGERASYYEPARGAMAIERGVAEHDHAGSQCLPLGEAIARYFVHDSRRCLDYLCTRPEVNPARLGVTGNSGGGTQTSLLMLCEPRLAAAAPATFIMDIRSWVYGGGAQDAEQVWPGFAGAGGDHEDILLAMAPKPVAVLAVSYDFFPIEGTRRTVARARRAWELFGRGDDLLLVEEATHHCYSPRLAAAAAEFFSAHLLGRKAAPEASRITARPPAQLWCTASGQVRGEIGGARFVFEENGERLAEAERERESRPEAERREAALGWLRQRIFAGRRPCDLNPRPYDSGQVQDLSASCWMWWSQEGVVNNGVLLRSMADEGRDLPVTIALWSGGTQSLAQHAAWLRVECGAGRAVLVLDTSGVGGVAPNPLRKGEALGEERPYGTIRKLSDDLVWLGDSMAALRSYDVTRAVDACALLPGLRGGEVRVFGRGRPAVYGQLAAAVDPRIGAVEVAEGRGSYASWMVMRYHDAEGMRSVLLPGLVRQCDLPDLVRWTKAR